jgi:hypothetical protein
MARTLWSIDEEGTMKVDSFGPEKAQQSELSVEEVKPEEPEVEEEKVERSKLEETEAKDAETVEKKSEAVPEQTEPESRTEKSENKTTDDKPNEGQDTVEVTKTLATNTAGESILEEIVDKQENGDEVKEVKETKDEVIS